MTAPRKLLAPLLLGALVLGAGALISASAQDAGRADGGAAATEAHTHANPVQQARAPWTPETLRLAATLPVQEGGRIKPLDTLARFTLLKLNGKQSLKTPEGETLVPIAWLLDTLFFPERAVGYSVFQVQDAAVLDAVGLGHEGKKKRDRYSYRELLPAREKLFELAHKYERIEAKDRSSLERQVVELGSNLFEFERLVHYLDFTREELPLRASEGLTKVFPDAADRGYGAVLRKAKLLRFLFDKLQDPGVDAAKRETESKAIHTLANQVESLAARASGLALLPPDLDGVARPSAAGAAPEASKEWLTPADLWSLSFSPEPIDEQLALVDGLERLEAKKGDPKAFQAELASFHGAVTGLAEARTEYSKVPLEVTYYRLDLIYRALVVYLLSFLLVAVSWLRPQSTWLPRGVWAGLGLATLLLVAGITLRCVIRGRPPVTTLYETILFITAVGVLVAMAVEAINRQRVALSVGAVLGTAGLFLAYKYEMHDKADTMQPLIAVLDTNFWLSTHVTTVTMGYSAGLLASALAHVWLLGHVGHWLRDVVTGASRPLDKAFYRSLTRMTYGVLCFGLLFATVGTILGGIWANYSWGRFWGWDPKENGALMIVLWQLLILHARMGGYIRDFGLAVLSVLGGLVVAFSWWGVNLLGVGLHSYGFTSGVLVVLISFYVLEGLVLAVSCGWWLIDRLAARTAALNAAQPPSP